MENNIAAIEKIDSDINKKRKELKQYLNANLLFF